MMDYDPKRWKSTRMRNGFVYLMKKNELITIPKLRGIGARVIDRRFHLNPVDRNGRWYFGWICFDKPINEYDAMEAGLIPIFRKKLKEEEVKA